MINNGARITLGSDFPVEEINPLKGFYAAISRLSTDGTSPHGADGWWVYWLTDKDTTPHVVRARFPTQRLNRVEALRGMTIDPAYASFTEDILGSLVPGKRADYVVLSQDIMTVTSANILQTKVLATSIDGKIVFGAFRWRIYRESGCRFIVIRIWKRVYSLFPLVRKFGSFIRIFTCR